jgi:hypothetical protein
MPFMNSKFDPYLKTDVKNRHAQCVHASTLIGHWQHATDQWYHAANATQLTVVTLHALLRENIVMWVREQRFSLN